MLTPDKTDCCRKFHHIGTGKVGLQEVGHKTGHSLGGAQFYRGAKLVKKMAPRARFELATLRLTVELRGAKI